MDKTGQNAKQMSTEGLENKYDSKLPSSSETTSSCQAFLGSLVLRLWTLLLKLSIALCAKDWPPVVVEPEVPDQVDPFSSGWTCVGHQV